MLVISMKSFNPILINAEKKINEKMQHPYSTITVVPNAIYAGHLCISQRGCKNNHPLLYLTSKLSQLCLASHPIASCVPGVQSVSFPCEICGKRKTARTGLSCSL